MPFTAVGLTPTMEADLFCEEANQPAYLRFEDLFKCLL
jgi:hypothetical protein